MEININGIKTNYEVIGDGKPLVILHGWGSNCERWLEVAEEIAKNGYARGENGGFKIIIPDLPGFGKSDMVPVAWNTNKYITWLESFVKELGLKQFYLVGHSFGGALASKMAVKHPQDVEKLFLVSAACLRTKTTKKSVFRKASKVIKLFHFLPFYAFLRKAIYKFIIRKSDYVYVDGIMKETYLNVIAEDLSFHLSFIKVPTFIIWGDKDTYTPIEDAHIINKRVKNSKLFIIPGAGHDLNRKQPNELAETVLQNI